MGHKVNVTGPEKATKLKDFQLAAEGIARGH